MRKILQGGATMVLGVLLAAGVGAGIGRADSGVTGTTGSFTGGATGGAFTCTPETCPVTSPPVAQPSGPVVALYDGLPVAQYNDTVAKEQAVKGPEPALANTTLGKPVTALPSQQDQYEAQLCASLQASKPWIDWGCVPVP